MIWKFNKMKINYQSLEKSPIKLIFAWALLRPIEGPTKMDSLFLKWSSIKKIYNVTNLDLDLYFICSLANVADEENVLENDVIELESHIGIKVEKEK